MTRTTKNLIGLAFCMLVIMTMVLALATGAHGPWTFNLWGF